MVLKATLNNNCMQLITPQMLMQSVMKGDAMSEHTEVISSDFPEGIDQNLYINAEKLLVLPLNWNIESESPSFPSTSISVTKLLRQSDIPFETPIPLNGESHLFDHRSIDWVAPTLLVSGLLLSQNPVALAIALGVISNYVTNIFQGRISDPKVRLDVVFSDSSLGTKTIKYRGPASSLCKVNDIVKSLKSESEA